MAPRGRFLTFEGVDGAGKSTQAAELAKKLRASGRDVVLTREPGGSDGAEEIRRLLVAGAPGRWSPETEILLFTAARRDHLERRIEPALARGAWVVSDRFADSTRVYQGLARAELREKVDTLHRGFIGIEPDLTLILDLPPSVALARGRARPGSENRFEDMGLAFQTRLAMGFRALAATEPTRCRLIDANGPTDSVAERVSEIVDDALS
ncbi:MAG: dTMP kinase [Pseudomonadota bacterium]